MPFSELALALGAGFLAGLGSIPHCIAMCGPLSGVACRQGNGQDGSKSVVRYQLGRALGYGTLGTVVGAAGEVVVRSLSGAVAGAMISWVLAVAIGIAAYRLWFVQRPAAGGIGSGGGGGLVQLGAGPSVGSSSSKDPASPTLLERVLDVMPKDPFFFGTATALLPCGALYAAAFLAAGTMSPVGGAVLMLGFAAATGVGLASFGLLLARFGRLVPRAMLKVVAVGLAVVAVFFVIRPISQLTAPEEATPACCAAME